VGCAGAVDADGVGSVAAWMGHRLAVEGMVWKYRTGAPWRDVSVRFGKWNSIYKRFNRWAEDGTWEKAARRGAEAG
jgi:transposase